MTSQTMQPIEWVDTHCHVYEETIPGGANGPNALPFAYLKATLEAIAGGHHNDRLDELLPWSWAPTSS